jgi:hypothetical protein
MTKENDTTPELSQSYVDSITDPLRRSNLQKLLDIVKDAPPIPGLAELEEKYGVGNIPMIAVHESTKLSLKEKKFLFKIAGFEYDGSLHKGN